MLALIKVSVLRGPEIDIFYSEIVCEVLDHFGIMVNTKETNDTV